MRLPLVLLCLESHLDCTRGVLCSFKTFPFPVIYKVSVVGTEYGRNCMMQLEIQMDLESVLTLRVVSCHQDCTVFWITIQFYGRCFHISCSFAS